MAVEQPEGVGVDPDQKFDVPSAYLELKEKGTDESLGVYMVTALSLREPQTVKSGGVDYEISLRPHRDYKDYTLQLEEFTHTVYPGTNVPKEFKSRIQLVDPDHHEDREVLIYMNQPLRYQGETFYQAGVLGRDEGHDSSSGPQPRLADAIHRLHDGDRRPGGAFRHESGRSSCGGGFCHEPLSDNIFFRSSSPCWPSAILRSP